MTKKQINFLFTIPINQNIGNAINKKWLYTGEVLISGVGYETERGEYDLDSFDYNEIIFTPKDGIGVNILPLVTFLRDTTLDGADWVDNATLQHVIKLFGGDIEDTTTDYNQDVQNVFGSLGEAFRPSFHSKTA